MTNNAEKQAPIAVVGLGAMFPGRGNTIGYWRDILEACDTSGDVPETHWRIDDYFDSDPKAPDKTYASRGAFIPSFAFDPMEFGTPPNVVETTDTVQLMALYVAKQVLNEATRSSFSTIDRERASVILGVAAGTELIGDMASRLNRPIWLKAMREGGVAEDEAHRIADRISSHFTEWRESTFPGLLGNVVAGRIANRLDLNGTNFTADAACASSLAALKHAMQELWLGQSDLVLTGGADALNNIFMYMCFSKTPAMSPTGACRPFSEDADGTLMGEGCGILALRRLEDAERDGNPIYAVIRGIGTSSDGSGTSVYAPRAGGQALALRRAYEMAGYSPQTVGLVEAHGTGTRAGDAAEFGGLSEVFADESGGTTQWCALGSVKSQIGHTKSAAGAAGLIKTVLALHHKVLPPTINVGRPNPKLSLRDSPFYLNTSSRPWLSRVGKPPRRASVSSFGFGGSNFHVTLEEYAGTGARPAKYRTQFAELFLFSAATAEGLRAAAEARSQGIANEDDLAHHAKEASSAFRSKDRYRLAIVAKSLEDLAEKVSRADAMLAQGKEISTPDLTLSIGDPQSGSVAFLFSGQGSQYLDMGSDLAMAFDCAREIWETADEGTPELAAPLSDIVFPRSIEDADDQRALTARLTATENAQPAIAATALSQLSVLAKLGLKPDATAGHSFGEVMALHAAGSFDAGTALAIARGRGAAMAEASRGSDAGMLAVMAGKDAVATALCTQSIEVTIANDNGPEQVILSGSKADLATAAEKLAAKGMQSKMLPVATGFHSKFVAKAADRMSDALAEHTVSAPRVPVYANATANHYPADDKGIKRTLAEQLSKPVRFRETIEAMYAGGVRTFVEVGPKSVLTQLVGQNLGDRPHVAVAVDSQQANGVLSLLRAVGRLAAAGLEIDLGMLWAEAPAAAPAKAPSKHAIWLNGANYKKPYPPARTEEHVPPAMPAAAEARAASPTSLPENDRPDRVNAPVSGPAPARLLQMAQEKEESQPLAVAATAPSVAQTAACPVKQLVSQVVSEKTGYPTEMLDHDMDLEAELGIDSIKQVEILSALRERLPSMPEIEPSRLAELRTLAQITTALGSGGTDGRPHAQTFEKAPEEKPMSSSSPKPATHTAPVAAEDAATEMAPGSNRALDQVRAVVAEKTGYPEEMLDAKMDLEGELGIDSIKQVEILSSLRERMPSMPVIEPSRLAELRTLAQIAVAIGDSETGTKDVVPSTEKISAEATLSAAIPVSAPTISPSADSPGESETRDMNAHHLDQVREVVAEKTGYPVEMLDPKMDLEGELGIDSIKQVEILSALRERLPSMPDIEPARLAELRTLAQIASAMGAPYQSVGEASKTQVEPIVAQPESMPQEPRESATRVVPATDNSSAGLTGNSTGVLDEVRAVVAEKTGYPPEMLEPGMDLEAELGIDSIKQVEILSELTARLPNMPNIEPAQLATLRTLAQIAEAISGSGDASADAVTESQDTAAATPISTQSALAQPLVANDQAQAEEIETTVTGEADSSGQKALDELRAIVAEKTGYPPEMLEPEMDLEAELGIDSIKQVEILSALRERLPHMPELEPARLAELRTLAQIASAVGGEIGKTVSDQTGAGTPDAMAVSGEIPSRSSADSQIITMESVRVDKHLERAAELGLYRQIVELQAIPVRDAAGDRLRPDSRIAVTNCAPEIARAIVKNLNGRGMKAAVADPDPVGDFDAVIITSGLSEALTNSEIHLAALRIARSAAQTFGDRGGALITLQDTGGTFGRTLTDVYAALGGGLSGLVKTANQEWPNVWAKAIDIEQRRHDDGQGVDVDDLAERIADEIMSQDDDVEVGLTLDGQRLVPVCKTAVDRESHDARSLSDGAVVVVSGGARGVTARAVIEVASTARLRFALFGRSRLTDVPASIPDEATEAEIRGILAREAMASGEKTHPREIAEAAARIVASREISETLEAVRRAGSQAEYFALDVTDHAAVMHRCSIIRRNWGPISGIVHGAGVLADKLIKDKTDAQFTRVFSTKVDGFQALLAACASDPLEFVNIFSSIAARYGNPGQADYAMANEALNRAAWALRNTRPDCHVTAINWGPWDGGMADDQIRSQFEARGIPIIPVDVGAAAFVRDLALGQQGCTEIVFAGIPHAASDKVLTAL